MKAPLVFTRDKMKNLTIHQMDNIVAKIDDLQEALLPIAQDNNPEFFYPLAQMILDNTSGLKLRMERELKERLENS